MTGGGSRPPVAAWGMAVGAMVSVQLGSALSVPLSRSVGAGGVAWLRLTAGAVIFIAVARPTRSSLSRRSVAALVALGITTGFETVAFLAAIQRIQLGTAVAVEFLGPLTVAAARTPRRRALAWPALALTGVILLTRPWHGHVNAVGLGLAVLAAAGWAAYILLTQHVGDRIDGITALSLTVPIAAATAAVIGIPQALGHLTFTLVPAAVGLGLLLPVIPYAFEMLALRHITPHAFGTLMALEPAIGLLLGLLVLRQQPTSLQLLGILLVVTAGAAAQHRGQRDPSPRSTTPPPPPPPTPQTRPPQATRP